MNTRWHDLIIDRLEDGGIHLEQQSAGDPVGKAGGTGDANREKKIIFTFLMLVASSVDR
jgi:hypothetical protein